MGPMDSRWIRQALGRHEANLVRYALRITGNLETARDAVQDTFMKLLKEPRAEIEGHLAEWLYTVCRNRAIDLVRKEANVSALEDRHVERTDTAEPSPRDFAESREAAAGLLAVVATLPPRQQEVLRLRFGGGLGYKEISRVSSDSRSATSAC